MKTNKRYKFLMLNGEQYVFDKYVFRLSIFLMIIILFIGVYENKGFAAKLHIYCKGPGECINPLYQVKDFYAPNPERVHFITEDEAKKMSVPEYVRNMKTLPAGFEINKPGFFAIYGDELIFLLVFLSFVVNHLLHNRDIKIKKLVGGE